MLFIGVTDFSKVMYSVLYLYIGKLCSTGVLDVFCQFFIIGSNVQTEELNVEEPQVYLFSLLFTTIVLIFLSLCCCTDVITAYVEQYQTLENTKEKLMPRVFCHTDGLKQEMCAICLEVFNSGQKVAAMLTCDHNFHERCLDRWFGYKKICPICRSEKINDN